jgi:hypothetical protein
MVWKLRAVWQDSDLTYVVSPQGLVVLEKARKVDISPANSFVHHPYVQHHARNVIGEHHVPIGSSQACEFHQRRLLIHQLCNENTSLGHAIGFKLLLTELFPVCLVLFSFTVTVNDLVLSS